MIRFRASKRTKGQRVLPQTKREAAASSPGSILSPTLGRDHRTPRPLLGMLGAYFHALDVSPGLAGVVPDEAILATVKELDEATMNTQLPLGTPVTLARLLGMDASDAPASATLQARYLTDVKEVESELGPHVPALVKPQGRRRKDSTDEATEVHALRVTPSIWNDLVAKAIKMELTPNSAAPFALSKWSRR